MLWFFWPQQTSGEKMLEKRPEDPVPSRFPVIGGAFPLNALCCDSLCCASLTWRLIFWCSSLLGDSPSDAGESGSDAFGVVACVQMSTWALISVLKKCTSEIIRKYTIWIYVNLLCFKFQSYIGLYIFLFCFLFVWLVIRDRVSLCILGWPGTCSEDQAGLKFTEIHLPPCVHVF